MANAFNTLVMENSIKCLVNKLQFLFILEGSKRNHLKINYNFFQWQQTEMYVERVLCIWSALSRLRLIFFWLEFPSLKLFYTDWNRGDYVIKF